MSYKERPSEEFLSVLRQSGDGNLETAMAAQREFAVALETPLRQGVLVGNILGNIFEKLNLEPGKKSMLLVLL